MAQQLQFRVNTSKRTAEDYGGQRYRTNPNDQIGKPVQMVNGDVVTLVCDFNEENLSGLVENMDLTGALALRAVLSSSLDTPQTIYSFQDVYNSGIVPGNEDLASGLVTWNLFVDPANVDPALPDGVESTEAWLELVWIDPNGFPQTFVQLPVVITQQIDESLAGTPPPSEPTYMTAATALATFVLQNDYIVPETLSGAGVTAVTGVDGIKSYRVAPGAANVREFTLPDVNTVDDKFILIVTKIEGDGTLRVTPFGAQELNSNGGGSEDLLSACMEFLLIPDPTNDRWIIPTLATV